MMVDVLLILGCLVMGWFLTWSLTYILSDSSSSSDSKIESYDSNKSYVLASKMDRLVEGYLKADPLDMTATPGFILAAEALEDPFRAPSSVAKPVIKPWATNPPASVEELYQSVINDIGRTYAVNPHMMLERVECQCNDPRSEYHCSRCEHRHLAYQEHLANKLLFQ